MPPIDRAYFEDLVRQRYPQMASDSAAVRDMARELDYAWNGGSPDGYLQSVTPERFLEDHMDGMARSRGVLSLLAPTGERSGGGVLHRGLYDYSLEELARMTPSEIGSIRLGESYDLAEEELRRREAERSRSPHPFSLPVIRMTEESDPAFEAWRADPARELATPSDAGAEAVLRQVMDVMPEYYPRHEGNYETFAAGIARRVMQHLEDLSPEIYRSRFHSELRSRALWEGGAPRSLVSSVVAASYPGDSSLLRILRQYFRREPDALRAFEVSLSGLEAAGSESVRADPIDRVVVLDQIRERLDSETMDRLSELTTSVLESWRGFSQAQREEFLRSDGEGVPEGGLPEVVVFAHVEAVLERGRWGSVGSASSRAVERLRDPESRSLLEESLRTVREAARMGRW